MQVSGSEIDKLNSDLRAGALEGILLQIVPYIVVTSLPAQFNLDGLIWRIQEFSQRHLDSSGTTRSAIASSPRHPHEVIVRFFAEWFFVDQLFAYLSHFPRADPGKTAEAYEQLEASRILHETLHESLQLNFFRLAQKIRNEFGISRKNSHPLCFQSFEDIMRLEQNIKDKELTDFLLQLVALKVMDFKHMIFLHEELPSRSQLLAFHKGFRQLYPQEDSLYEDEFQTSFKWEGLGPPTWQEAKEFLRLHDGEYLDAINGVERDVPNEELDTALCCVLNYLVRTRRFYCGWSLSWLRSDTVTALVERGANWFFKDPDEELSSLGAIGRLVNLEAKNHKLDRVPEFQKLLVHICCPLKLEEKAMKYDNGRLAPLSCLAARRITSPLHDVELPRGFRTFIQAHQELRLEIEGERSDARHPDGYENLRDLEYDFFSYDSDSDSDSD